jgi:hypothetical protein
MIDDAPTFGILDILPKDIRSPPEFTEPATLGAMLKLGVQPLDLVCPEFLPDRGFEDMIAIELERRRIEKIQQIISERSRILEEPPVDISQFLLKLIPEQPRVRRRKPKKPRNPREERLPSESEDKEQIIHRRAQERMSFIMNEQNQMKQRKEQRQEEVRRMQLQEERRIERLREQKLVQYEKEKQKRMAHFEMKPRSRVRLKGDQAPVQETGESQPQSILLNGPRLRRVLRSPIIV